MHCELRRWWRTSLIYNTSPHCVFTILIRFMRNSRPSPMTLEVHPSLLPVGMLMLFGLTRLPSNLMQTTRACLYFRSRDRDVRRGREPHSARELHGRVFYRTAFVGHWSYIAGVGNFVLCCACDLDLDPMNFAFEILWRCPRTQGYRKLNTYTYTDRCLMPSLRVLLPRRFADGN